MPQAAAGNLETLADDALAFVESAINCFARRRLLSFLYSALGAVNAMLLNEFLKEHRKVQKLEAALEAVTARLTKQETDLQQGRAQVASNSVPHFASRD